MLMRRKKIIQILVIRCHHHITKFISHSLKIYGSEYESRYMSERDREKSSDRDIGRKENDVNIDILSRTRPTSVIMALNPPYNNNSSRLS